MIPTHPIQSYIPQCPRKDGMISEDGVPSPNLATNMDNRFLEVDCAESITSFNPIWQTDSHIHYPLIITLPVGFYYHNPSGWRN